MPDKPHCTLFVANLPYSSDETDIGNLIGEDVREIYGNYIDDSL